MSSKPAPETGRTGTRVGNVEEIGEVGDSLYWTDDLGPEALSDPIHKVGKQ